MSNVEVFVVELVAVNRFAADACAVSEIAALDHELRNDSVELGILVVQGLAAATHTFLAGTESSEIFRCLWDNIVEELKRDFARRITANRNVEEHLGALYLGHLFFW